MGDTRRFDVFAEYVARHWPDRSARIADVAGGKGGLQAALRQRGFRNVVTIDRRRKCANPERENYRYGWFDATTAEDFDLLVGMHPDGATRAIVTAGKPFAVVPCCSEDGLDYFEWVAALARLADGSTVAQLPMNGRSLVISSHQKVAACAS